MIPKYVYHIRRGPLNWYDRSQEDSMIQNRTKLKNKKKIMSGTLFARKFDMT